MTIPFTPEQLDALADQYGTPLWVYDAATIRSRIAQLQSFDTVRFAQKACSNIHILRLMREQGVKVDAVSRGEVLRALAAGYQAGASRRTSSSPPTCSMPRPWPPWWSTTSRSMPDRSTCCTSWACAARPPGMAAYQSRFWPRPQQQDQHRRRTQQARHLAHRPETGPASRQRQQAQAGGAAHAHRLRGRLRPPGTGLRCHGGLGAHHPRRRA